MASDLPYFVIAALVVIFAAANVWVERRVERRHKDPYLPKLREHPHYRAHRRKRR